MPRRPNGRRKPRTPVNVVYRSIRAAGGPTALARTLGVSLATLARWRAAGQLESARYVLEWVELLHPSDEAAALTLARRLAGLAPRRR